jgi:hypothetical protein
MLEREPDAVKGSILASSPRKPLPPALAISLVLFEGCSIPERIWRRIEGKPTDDAGAGVDAALAAGAVVAMTPGGRARPGSAASGSANSAAGSGYVGEAGAEYAAEEFAAMRTNFSNVTRRTSIEPSDAHARVVPTAAGRAAQPKATICRKWEEYGKCGMEVACPVSRGKGANADRAHGQYAHGRMELRAGPSVGIPAARALDATPRVQQLRSVYDRRASCAPRISASEPVAQPFFRRPSEPSSTYAPRAHNDAPIHHQPGGRRDFAFTHPLLASSPSSGLEPEMPWLHSTVNYLRHSLDGDVTPRAFSTTFDAKMSAPSPHPLGSSALASPPVSITACSMSPTTSFVDSVPGSTYTTFHTSYSTSSLSSIASNASSTSMASPPVRATHDANTSPAAVHMTTNATQGVPASWSKFSLDDEGSWDEGKYAFDGEIASPASNGVCATDPIWF